MEPETPVTYVSYEDRLQAVEAQLAKANAAIEELLLRTVELGLAVMAVATVKVESAKGEARPKSVGFVN